MPLRLKIFYALSAFASLFVLLLGVGKLPLSVPAGVILIIGGIGLSFMCTLGFLADRNSKS